MVSWFRCDCSGCLLCSYLPVWGKPRHLPQSCFSFSQSFFSFNILNTKEENLTMDIASVIFLTLVIASVKIFFWLRPWFDFIELKSSLLHGVFWGLGTPLTHSVYARHNLEHYTVVGASISLCQHKYHSEPRQCCYLYRMVILFPSGVNLVN